jgi:hypothetical protein
MRSSMPRASIRTLGAMDGGLDDGYLRTLAGSAPSAGGSLPNDDTARLGSPRAN